MHAQVLNDLALDVRHKTLQIFKAAHDHELLWTPAGTANHILWHAGHALWVNDALCVQVATGKSELPAGWSALFRMGSRPALETRPWPARNTLVRALEAQLSRLQAILERLSDAAYTQLPPFAHAGDDRTLGHCVLHGLHDEANHQGEMYLLLKMQRLK